MFEDFEEELSDLNLIQLVQCSTWSRIVYDCFRDSLLDHIYVTDPKICNVLWTVKPCFGDHLLVSIELNLCKSPVTQTFSGDWRRYSKDALCAALNEIVWDYDYDSVKNFWDYFENVLIEIVDNIVPLVTYSNNRITTPLPKNIKDKLG